MQAQFTEQTRRALAYAYAEAGENGSSCVEPEHLLLAILRDDHGEARAELCKNGHSPGALVEEVSALLDAQSVAKERAATPLAPTGVVLSARSQSVLTAAARIAAQHGRYYMGTDHVLAALLSEPTEILAGVWARHGVSADVRPDGARIAPVRTPAVPSLIHDRPEWNRYTFGAKQAVAHATTETVQSGYNRLTPAYLLAGILQESDTVTARALRPLGIERNILRAALVDTLETGRGRSEYTVLFTKATLAAFEEAYRVSATLGDKHIGTEHLFLGLLAGQGETADLLRSRGIATANFLTALRSVKRGKRAEGENMLIPPAARIGILIVFAVLVCSVLFLSANSQ